MNTDGEIISLHGWSNCLILYYNKAMFEAAGLDPEAPPKNWDEIIEYGKKLTDATRAFGALSSVWSATIPTKGTAGSGRLRP